MAEQDELTELVRRELQLQFEIARHELECLTDDDAPISKIEAKLDEFKLIEARQSDMARREALRAVRVGLVHTD